MDRPIQDSTIEPTAGRNGVAVSSSSKRRPLIQKTGGLLDSIGTLSPTRRAKAPSLIARDLLQISSPSHFAIGRFEGNSAQIDWGKHIRLRIFDVTSGIEKTGPEILAL